MDKIDSCKNQKWDGIDFDGTLSYYEKWEGHTKFGPPIKEMCEFVKKEHDNGRNIKIFTARVSEVSLGGFPREDVVMAIQDWCENHIGFRPEVTCEKDRWLNKIYDDRAVSVIKNKGIMLNPQDENLEEFLSRTDGK